MAIASIIQLGLPTLPDENYSPEMYNEFLTIYKAIKNLQDGVGRLTGIDAPEAGEWSQSPPSSTILTGNATRMYVLAAEYISPGQLVNLYDNAGTLFARLASASSATTMAHGIANTVGVVGQLFEMQFLRASVRSIGGMALGTLYYLSTTPGAVQNLPPVVAGTIQQPVGVAVATNNMLLDISLSFKQN